MLESFETISLRDIHDWLPFRSYNTKFASHGASVDITAEIPQLILRPHLFVDTLGPRRVLIVITNHCTGRDAV